MRPISSPIRWVYVYKANWMTMSAVRRTSPFVDYWSQWLNSINIMGHRLLLSMKRKKKVRKICHPIFSSLNILQFADRCCITKGEKKITKEFTGPWCWPIVVSVQRNLKENQMDSYLIMEYEVILFMCRWSRNVLRGPYNIQQKIWIHFFGFISIKNISWTHRIFDWRSITIWTHQLNDF